MESITGANKRLTLPEGDTLDVKIPPGLVDGQILRLKGKGVAKRGGGHGDVYVSLKIVLPDTPDERLTDMVKEWTTANPYDPRKNMEA